MMKAVLYSFRRCPYAMRARAALRYAGCAVQIHEVSLKAKPPEMLERSPKGTVPVLVLEDQVIDQSLDIMHWALAQNDPDGWLLIDNGDGRRDIQALIEENDHVFKQHLDRYKYFVRHPEYPQAHYRQQGEVFLQKLEARLKDRDFLITDRLSLADTAVAPFIRQFSAVDPDWFATSPYPKVRGWLDRFIQSALFKAVMVK
ncbi:glutathione S-transferase [Pseudomonas quasicaspiana]|uniref:glutathione S-transferase n=1 Tax=Pseudomonas quasicaspiana TaxID=2829821 RepID=UPI001E45908C|nr:glutathione S-transferase [Pseudomonas quasicaspiana]MCD5979228.1 glutathione S-transferase [Pseudomonas quasicaspiana]